MNDTTTIRCLIIDDEPLAITVIKNYLLQMSNYEVVDTFENPVEAFKFLGKETIDLIFLDINMPMLNGLDFIRSLKKAPNVIFTTAYREYAIEGFEVDAIDYLVKPISFQRFLQALQKVERLLQPTSSTDTTSEESNLAIIKSQKNFAEAYTFFKVDKRMTKVFLKDIVYIESLKDYIKVITVHNTMIVHQTLTSISEMLPSHKFMRIHRSFTIGLDHLSAMEGNYVIIKGKDIPIGRNYQQEVKEAILKMGEM